jgi:hypothetical protein
MRRNGQAGAGTSLAEVKRRFDAWRREHRWLGRVPNELWRMAGEAAAVHGVEATAERLSLDPRRLEAWLPCNSAAATAGEAPTPAFVELPSLIMGPPAECALELEDASGRKLRILLKGPATAEALAISQMLWRGEA